jgi:para-nitrobenzyl esterase
MFLSSAGAESPDATAPPIATVKTGQLRGSLEDGIYIFKGIPYGAPTGGANRFKPPQPPKTWTGIRDARNFGDRCPQMPPPGGRELPSEAVGESEDCLVLNVWTPGLYDGKQRPVMVWLHGGGYVSGSGGVPIYDGARLAKRGDTVIVTLNHRLNVLGYLYLGGIAGPEYADSGNVGQLDLIAALQWVRDNVTEFGGDPQRVTIFGESGGGSKVGTLMAMPLAKGLFQGAILESGFGLTAIPAEKATETTDGVLAALNLRRNQVDELQTLPVAKLQEALLKVTGGTPLGVGSVLDGRSVPRHPFTPDAPAVSIDVPAIVGSNKDETTVLFPPPDAFDLDWAGLKTHLTTALPCADVDKVIAELRALRPRATPSDLYFTVTTELGMGANARTLASRKAAQGGAPVYLYRMEWETPVDGGRMRAHHGLDLPMVFDNVDKAAAMIGPGAADAQRVADAMSAAWLAFARTGNPNAPGLAYWPPFDSKYQPTMVFNVNSRAVTDPIHDVRLLLERASQASACK